MVHGPARLGEPPDRLPEIELSIVVNGRGTVCTDGSADLAPANGPLHIGHLRGPFFASDIAARAARARVERALANVGVDVGQNYTAKMAKAKRVDPQRLIERNRGSI